MKIIFIIALLMILFSCSSKKENSVSTEIEQKNENNFGTISVNKYKTDIGALSEVPSYLGGNGFETLADSLGFQTNTEYEVAGSPNAVKGGEINLSFSEYPSTFRPYGKDSNIILIDNLCKLVYEPLLKIDFKSHKYIPSLATHWKISDDNSEFIFRIDPNARWSDGKRITSEDVLETWKLISNDDILAPYTSEQMRKYEKPEILSPYLVKIKSKENLWRLFYEFSSQLILPAHHIKKIDPKNYLDKYQYKMMPGTGPYIFSENETIKGSQIVLKRRANYWAENYKRNTGMNNFDKIRFYIIRDNVLEKEKLKKGDLDLLDIGTAQVWVNEFMEDSTFDALNRGLLQKKKVFNQTPKGISGLAFNMRKPPFDDIRMRKAFAMLWNREQLIEKLFYNEYIPLRSTFPGSIYSNPENFRIDFNPVMANRLLDEAGWSERDLEGVRIKNGEKLEIDFAILQSEEKIFTPYQDDLRRAGIKLNLKISDQNSIYKMGDERRFKMIYESWSQGIFPNPESMQHSKNALKDGTANTPGTSDPRVDELIEKYNYETDPEKRIAYLQEMDKILSEIVHWSYSWYIPHAARLVYWNKFGKPDSYLPRVGDWMSIIPIWWYDKDLAKQLEDAKLNKKIYFDKGSNYIDYYIAK
ncbi:MAG: ABC transporter substrate-binding protein [Candidatus Delongbacteria bacterium]|nr:ABC transporter substrate-binding protein [Candidatus Delongbacteria bacterium]MBN2836588.1 ABC transporter substrate-binding protein [Candidatus Delongbacteria bacterium]